MLSRISDQSLALHPAWAPRIALPRILPATNCVSPAHPLPNCLPPAHSLFPVANLVPEFTRLGAPIRDFIAKDVPRLPGFNADDLNRLLLPDLIAPDNVYTLLLLVSCAAAFFYLEFGALVDDFLREQQFEELEENFLRDERRRQRQEDGKMAGSSEDEDSKAAKRPPRRVASERQRGLGWLALATALAIWSTGIVNKANPFQP